MARFQQKLVSYFPAYVSRTFLKNIESHIFPISQIVYTLICFGVHAWLNSRVNALFRQARVQSTCFITDWKESTWRFENRNLTVTDLRPLSLWLFAGVCGRRKTTTRQDFAFGICFRVCNCVRSQLHLRTVVTLCPDHGIDLSQNGSIVRQVCHWSMMILASATVRQ